MKPTSLFDAERQTQKDAIAETAAALRARGPDFRHWVIAYSGGKDSSAVATLVPYLIESGRVPAPKRLTVLYADTRQELPPLHESAMGVLDAIRARGMETEVVLPQLDKRFMVQIFGRGLAPPHNHFRWCTEHLKVVPMNAALARMAQDAAEPVLFLTGVRVGESASRDSRIAVSCSRDGAECGQGWFQSKTAGAHAMTMAPLLHWRVCHVWDWLEFDAPALGFPTSRIADAYGGDEARESMARTGCYGCPLVEQDLALENMLALDEWAYLVPLRRLRALYAMLRLPFGRLRKVLSDARTKDGFVPGKTNKLGPLTPERRRWGLDRVLAIQAEIHAAARKSDRPLVWIVNPEELNRIEWHLRRPTWPLGWSGTEPVGDELTPEARRDGWVQPPIGGLAGMGWSQTVVERGRSEET